MRSFKSSSAYTSKKCIFAAVGFASILSGTSSAQMPSAVARVPFKLATYSTDSGRARLGLVIADRFYDLQQAQSVAEKSAHFTRIVFPDDMRTLIERYDQLRGGLYRLANYYGSRSAPAFARDLKSVRFQSPIKYPWNLVNMAFNYWSHAHEMAPGREIKFDVDSDNPVAFAKSPRNTIIDPGAPFIIPSGRNKIDWEGELAVVMGPRPAKGLSKDNALNYVFGYTIINDISDRDPLKGHRGGAAGPGNDWFSQKSRDGAAPIGPYIVPREFMPDPQKIHMTTRVNGIVKQDGDTSDQIYDLRRQIRYITSILTLYPGDIIATGSQAGVGEARHPPEYLKAGDVVEVEINGIGTLTTPFRNER